MRIPKRAFLLITVLLLISILFVLCGAYLYSQVSYYRAARSMSWKAGARQLALSGLEDVRVKLMKDWKFPPLSLTQRRFTYVERVLDAEGSLVGTYRVTLQSHYMDKPFSVLYVQCEGHLGPPEQPVASHTVTALCDLQPLHRNGGGTPNPKLYRWLQIRDRDWKY